MPPERFEELQHPGIVPARLAGESPGDDADKYSSVGFMEQKKGYLAKIAAWRKELSGPKGLGPALDATEKSMQEKSADVKDLPQSTTSLKSTIESLVKDLGQLESQARELGKDNVDSFSVKIEEAKKRIDACETQVQEQLAAMKWQLKQATSTMRKGYQTKRWQLSKVQMKLQAGRVHATP